MIEHSCIIGMTFDDGTVWQFKIDYDSMVDVQVILRALQNKYNDFDFMIEFDFLPM